MLRRPSPFLAPSPKPFGEPIERIQRRDASSGRRPAALLEAAGVLTHKPENGAPIRGLSDLRPKRGVAASVSRLNEAGFFTVALIDLTAAEAIEPWRVAAISARLMAATGVQGVAYCDEPADTPSPRRIPAPGLIMEAALTYGLDLDRSTVIAASDAMRRAAFEAGIRSLVLLGEDGAAAPEATVVADLQAAEDVILDKLVPSAPPRRAPRMSPPAARAAGSVLDHPADQPLESRGRALLEEGASS